MAYQLGKLKKTLKEKCPFCNKVLQIRVISQKKLEFGEEIEVEKEVIQCSSCDFEKSPEKKKGKQKRKRERGDVIVTDS